MSNLVPSLESFAKGTLATTMGLTTVGLGLLYYGQGYLIYPSAFPPGSRTDVPVPSDFGLPYDEDLVLTTSDNVKLRCYFLIQKRDLGTPAAAALDTAEFESDEEFAASRPTVIMFHGNAGNHGHRIPLAKVFYVKMRCNVLMMAYRGYAHSEGSPSEKGLCLDSQAALDYLTSHPYLSKTPIVLYGQSIGGAVAIDLASRNTSTISALVLENTFLSLPRLLPHALPILSPFSFLCHQKWDSASKVPLIPPTTPILMLSGMKDEVVPKEHMRALWEIVAKRGEKRIVTAPNSSTGRRSSATSSISSAEGKTGLECVFKTGLERARFMEFQDGAHNDTCTQPGYWSAIADFIASLGDTSTNLASSPREKKPRSTS